MYIKFQQQYEFIPKSLANQAVSNDKNNTVKLLDKEDKRLLTKTDAISFNRLFKHIIKNF